LAAVLGFVGVKMLLADFVHIPIYLSLTVIVVAVGGSIGASLWLTRGREQPGLADDAEPEPAEEA
jgi:tellurite resistance protein TerC